MILDEDGNPIYSNGCSRSNRYRKLYERQLNGTDGKVSIEVDNQGRRMSVIDSTDPTPGKDIFSHVRQRAAKVAYDTLEKRASKSIIGNLTSYGKNSVPYYRYVYSHD